MEDHETIASALRTELDLISAKWRAERQRLYKLINNSQDGEEINSLFDELRNLFLKQSADRELALRSAINANTAIYLKAIN